MNAKDKVENGNAQAEVTAEQRIAELAKVIASGKATAKEMLELSQLLNRSVEEKKEQEFQANIDEIQKFIEDKGLTIEEVYQALKPPALKEVVFRWTDSDGLTHEIHKSARGKAPAWVKELKDNVTKAQALEMALNEDGKAWVEKTYAKK